MLMGERESIDLGQTLVAGAAGLAASRVKPGPSEWSKGPGPRGLEMEFGPPGHKLPKGFKVFDYFDPETGMATSQKSLDLARGYRNPAGIVTTGKKAINTIIDFEDYTKSGVTLTADQITMRRLDITIPKNAATEAQRVALRQVRAYGLDNNVVVRIIER